MAHEKVYHQKAHDLRRAAHGCPSFVLRQDGYELSYKLIENSIAGLRTVVKKNF